MIYKSNTSLNPNDSICFSCKHCKEQKDWYNDDTMAFVYGLCAFEEEGRVIDCDKVIECNHYEKNTRSTYEIHH